MEALLKSRQTFYAFSHLHRHRLSQLFVEAAKYPIVTVCAGAGYGKTSAVHDFLQEHPAVAIWMQLSERDNVGARFWENLVHAIAPVNTAFAANISKIGFPDTMDKLNQFFADMNNLFDSQRRIIVLDDFHFIENKDVCRFIERAQAHLPSNTSLFLISRATPCLNMAGLISKGLVFSINENDLRFTEKELAKYFYQQKISLRSHTLREIFEDTGGWAFAINLVGRSYKKAPGYEGYLRSAMRTNIFSLMETEIFDEISQELQHFLIRLSLIDHLSMDLIALLAQGKEELIPELERQNAYIRRDNYINAYLIQHLFLEFLSQKQHLLSEEERRETYTIAGDWCNTNGFKIDALSYYEKVGDYDSVVSIFFELPTQVPQDIARLGAEIFSRAPEEAFDRVELLAVMHVRVVICLGLWQEALELVRRYEERFLGLPEDNHFRNRTLGGIYYCWGIMRSLMCTTDNKYDFEQYYAKMDHCLSKSPVDPGRLSSHPVGPWMSLVGSAATGAPQKYIDALTRAVVHTSHCLNGAMMGADDLARGELKFYQGELQEAEHFLHQAVANAGLHGQHEVVNRGLFYLMRIALAQGSLRKTEQFLKEMENQLEERDYFYRFTSFDIALAWYYAVLDVPDLIPDWLKEKFAPYGHAYFIENFGNQAKARYCYLVKNYPPLLAYIQEQKQRESILFGRVEMLAIESGVYYKMRDKPRALETLAKAYALAAPNDILMPFIELGKDMRSLTAAALKCPEVTIPQAWLELVNRKAATYAKRQGRVAADYKHANRIDEAIALTPRETDILNDLSYGLSRSEIAVNHNLSINTVKMVINAIYAKLEAENLPDMVRIAVERKLI